MLLHACCAPCCGEIIEAILASGLDLTVVFDNPNIQPRTEYDRRKAEVIRLVRQNGATFVGAEDDPAGWQARTQGLEQEPERGRRCDVCFELRLERTARYARDHGFTVFTSSLGISRWKDMAQLTSSSP